VIANPGDVDEFSFSGNRRRDLVACGSGPGAPLQPPPTSLSAATMRLSTSGHRLKEGSKFMGASMNWVNVICDPVMPTLP
jgi:hypothetical protein